MEERVYQKAWQRLLRELDKKTGWGKIELKTLMLKCLINPDKGAGNEKSSV